MFRLTQNDCKHRPRTAHRLQYALACVSVLFLTQITFGQSTLPNGGGGGIFAGGGRPFVTGVIPVVGANGAIGGISIDAKGVVSRADVDMTNALRRARTEAFAAVPADTKQPSACRKISLRRLESAIQQKRADGLPLGPEIELLGGLQRIEFVFVDKANRDIILAGPAEGWTVDDTGNFVGIESGKPALQLCDLIVALRTEKDEAINGITCSMDATEDGLNQYARLMKSGRQQMNRETVERMRNAIGDFQISLTGVPADSHFARVLVAADLMLKRLGMNLEQTPVRQVPSYIKMLKDSKTRIANNSMPRFWLSTNYEPLLRDEAGMAWQLRGSGVKAMTEEELILASGEKASADNENALGQKWANQFTENYFALSKSLPVFAELRNCMDLSVVAALLIQHELFEKADFESQVLTEGKQIELAKFHVPQTTEPQVSVARKGRAWIVGVSGGIDIDGWAVASTFEIDDKLVSIQEEALQNRGAKWWWD